MAKRTTGRRWSYRSAPGALELSQRARAHFEADPEDKTDDGIKGRECLMDIEEILKAAARRKR